MENIPDNHCAKYCRDVIRTDGALVVLTCFSYATNFEYCELRLVRGGTAQFKIVCKFVQNQKLKNLTPSVDGEYSLESLCEVSRRSVAN